MTTLSNSHNRLYETILLVPDNKLYRCRSADCRPLTYIGVVLDPIDSVILLSVVVCCSTSGGYGFYLEGDRWL